MYVSAQHLNLPSDHTSLTMKQHLESEQEFNMIKAINDAPQNRKDDLERDPIYVAFIDTGCAVSHPYLKDMFVLKNSGVLLTSMLFSCTARRGDPIP